MLMNTQNLKAAEAAKRHLKNVAKHQEKSRLAFEGRKKALAKMALAKKAGECLQRIVVWPKAAGDGKFTCYAKTCNEGKSQLFLQSPLISDLIT